MFSSLPTLKLLAKVRRDLKAFVAFQRLFQCVSWAGLFWPSLQCKWEKAADWWDTFLLLPARILRSKGSTSDGWKSVKQRCYANVLPRSQVALMLTSNAWLSNPTVPLIWQMLSSPFIPIFFHPSITPPHSLILHTFIWKVNSHSHAACVLIFSPDVLSDSVCVRGASLSTDSANECKQAFPFLSPPPHRNTVRINTQTTLTSFSMPPHYVRQSLIKPFIFLLLCTH